MSLNSTLPMHPDHIEVVSSRVSLDVPRLARPGPRHYRVSPICGPVGAVDPAAPGDEGDGVDAVLDGGLDGDDGVVGRGLDEELVAAGAAVPAAPRVAVSEIFIVTLLR